MTVADEELIYGWRTIADTLACSERYARDLVTSRQLVAARRTDGAVGVRRVDVVAIAEELRRGRGDQSVDRADVGDQVEENAHGAAPVLRLVSSEPAPVPAGIAGAQHATGDGNIAAQVFADLAAGHPLTQIVIDRKLSPDTVRRLHGEWVALSDVDALRKPRAEARLTAVEAAVGELSTKLEATTTRQPVSDPADWATPKWLHDLLADRVGVIEQVLLARGMLVRRAAPLADR